MYNLAILIGQVMVALQWVSPTWHEPWLYTITSDVSPQIVGGHMASIFATLPVDVHVKEKLKKNKKYA